MAKPKGPTITRRIPASIRTPLRAYATVIGEVVWASNYAHGAFEILFSHVATHDGYQIGRNIWHTSSSDSGQLKMLEAATEASDRLSKQMRERILWAIGRAQKLGEQRNDAVHSSTIVLTENGKARIAPSDIGTKPSRSAKLRLDADLNKKFKAVTGDLLQIGQYIHALWPHIAGFDHLPPLPKRPQLKSVPKQTQRKATRAHKK